MTTTQTQLPYKTTELELASFLKARGHRLLAAKMDGRFVSFELPTVCRQDVGFGDHLRK
jgi:hypothetical protein